MKIIRNNLLPVGRQYAAINLFGMLLIKHGVRVTPELINHERIHSAQMRELLYLPFYIAYLAEWLVRPAAATAMKPTEPSLSRKKPTATAAITVISADDATSLNGADRSYSDTGNSVGCRLF